MALSLVTAPALEPITIAEAKAHCRIDVDDENDLLDGLIRAGRQWIEAFTHRALMTQTWDEKRNQFPIDEDVIVLPMAPLISVTSITYLDTAGSTQTWSSALYTVDAPAGPHARPGWVYPIYGGIFPATQGIENAVTIRFVAGYGATAATVPAVIRACLKEYVRIGYARGSDDQALKALSRIEADLWASKAF